jgi:glycine betaine/proline transport system substrate-binding protein
MVKFDFVRDRNHNLVRRNPLLMARLLAAALVVALSVVACGGENPTIRLHAWQTDSHFFNNAIFEFIVENGYGYPVETVVSTTPVLQESLPAGEVDLNLEGWQQNVPDWYDEQIDKGSVVNLGMNYEGGPQFYMIPAWVAEEHGIETIFDMQNHWQLFEDPQDPSKGIFFGGVIGWEALTINEIKLQAYGLDRYYNLVAPGSGKALGTALARGQDDRQPVFGYYWSPNGLMGTYDWHILKEPAHTDVCWEEVIAAVQDPSQRPINEACEYPNPPIDKIAHSGLQGKAGDVVEMVTKMSVGLAPLNATLAWVDESGTEDWEAAAIHYLRTNPSRWQSWVTPDARENVNSALEEIAE